MGGRQFPNPSTLPLFFFPLEGYPLTNELETAFTYQLHLYTVACSAKTHSNSPVGNQRVNIYKKLILSCGQNTPNAVRFRSRLIGRNLACVLSCQLSIDEAYCNRKIKTENKL